MTKRILVTGGAGFIGSNFVDYMNTHDPGTHVTVYDDFSTGLDNNLAGAQCTVIRDSILNAPALVHAARGVDSIVHLAAIGSVPLSVAHPRPTHDANATGTLNVLEAARENSVDHVVVASSSSVYGLNPSLPKNELNWTRPLSPYAASKLATESYALAYGASYGMRTLAFRFFNVYGPRQRADHPYAAVIPKFIDSAIAGRPLVIHGDGLQSRDFTYVESVCSTLYDSVMRHAQYNQPVNLAFGTNTTLLDLVAELEDVLNCTVALEHQEPRAGDVRSSQADTSLLGTLFPEARPVSLRVGLKNTVEWFARGD
jgi:UDP-glucose 4-epimerase